MILYDSDGTVPITKTNMIYRIKTNPEIWDKKKMLGEGYPSPSREEYFIYEIESINELWIDGKTWDISLLRGYTSGNASPFSVSLAELMQSVLFTK